MDWDQVQYPWCNSIEWLRLRVKKSTLNLNYWIEIFLKKVERKLKNRNDEKLMWEEVG